ncbi:MAG: ABC transporter permease, partial [Acidobacteriota bacterium]
MPQAFYRALLYCYPAAFRQEYGHQMALAFHQQLQQSPGRAASLWWSAAKDVFTIAPKEHSHVILQDLRYTFRSIAARPGFAVVAVLSLALGIGTSTAIFSLWNTLVRGNLPVVREPQQLVILTDPNAMGSWHGNLDGDRPWMSYPEYVDIRAQAANFSALMASQASLTPWQVSFEDGAKEEVHGHLVSGNYFDALGVSPALGHAFTLDDERPNTAPYAVISHRYWTRRFGGRADIIGKTLTIRGTPLTIVGVAPRGFIGEIVGQQPDLWIPIGMQSAVLPGDDLLHDTPPFKIMWLHVFGRLQPGVTLEQAQAQSSSIFKAGLESFYGDVKSEQQRRTFLDQRLRLRPAARGASGSRDEHTASLKILFTAVGVLLLIACANLANLLLARGAARRPEIALRLSLGASRARLIRQLLTENLVLALAGGIAGLSLAYYVHGYISGLIARGDPSLEVGFSLDWMVVGFATATTFGTSLLFGLLPAWQLTKTDAGEALKEQSRSATGSLGRMRWGKALVSFQFALSLPLLVAAGFLGRTVYDLQHKDLGYPTQGLLQIQISPRDAGYDPDRRDALLAGLLTEFQRIPGVRSASFSHNGVFTGTNTALHIEVEGYIAKGQNDRGSAADLVAPHYFAALVSCPRGSHDKSGRVSR